MLTLRMNSLMGCELELSIPKCVETDWRRDIIPSHGEGKKKIFGETKKPKQAGRRMARREQYVRNGANTQPKKYFVPLIHRRIFRTYLHFLKKKCFHI